MRRLEKAAVRSVSSRQFNAAPLRSLDFGRVKDGIALRALRPVYLWPPKERIGRQLSRPHRLSPPNSTASGRRNLHTSVQGAAMSERERRFQEFMAAMMAAGAPTASIKGLLEAHSPLIREFERYDPCELAAAYGGLLTVPELQSNCLRLEALCHMAVISAHGKRSPNPKLMRDSFAAFRNSSIGRMEDPAEDLFVKCISTPRGNFRVIEGIWESGGFFLQRFVNVVEMMPAAPGYDHIREAVYALLTLSDAVCSRAELPRWGLGESHPKPILPPKIANAVRDLLARVTFTEQEVIGLGVSSKHLAQFVFNPMTRCIIVEEEIGHTHLERYPILRKENRLLLALPTAVSAAIRRFILERITKAGMRDAFLTGLGAEYSATFRQMPLLGHKIGVTFRFERAKVGISAVVMAQVDEGRYLTFIFFLDTLENIESTGIAGVNDVLIRAEAEISRLAERAAKQAHEDPAFREGVILVVSCGVGRGMVGNLPNPPDQRWRYEFLSAPDFTTLSWTVGFHPLSLWRLLDAQDEIEREGIDLQNVNGLLNLVAWQKSLRGNLVPLNQIPDDFVTADGRSLIMIEQAGLKAMRQQVVETWDPHMARDPKGEWVQVRKMSDSLFLDEAALPLYIVDSISPNGLPVTVYIAPNRAWWSEVAFSPESDRGMTYKRWEMVNVWLARVAPVLDAFLPNLPDGPLVWRVEFQEKLGHYITPEPGIDYEAAKAAIGVSVDRPSRTVTLVVREAHESAHFNAENIAERSLVQRAVSGFFDLTNTSITDKELTSLVGEIVRDVHARQMHAFLSRSFRDAVAEGRHSEVVLIDQDDTAALRVGLAWRANDRGDARDLYGKGDCIAFLNKLTIALEDELLSELRQYDRAGIIEALLKNHENAAVERDRWKRTAAAVMALHSNKAATRSTIAEQDGRRNAVFQTSRTLIELAQCVCPIAGGGPVGNLDLSRLMAKMGLVIHIGGWSDAMWHNAMEPRIHINPLGDVQVNHEFIDSIMDPFGRAISDATTEDAIASYARNLEAVEGGGSDENSFDPAFIEALREELGVGIDEMRIFLDYVEELGKAEDRLTFTVRRSQLLNPKVGDNALPAEKAGAFVEAITLKRRDDWRVLPAEYRDSDRQPWRYRRRLSPLRRPLIQITDDVDPVLMIAPGLLREAAIYLLDNYHRGDFPQWQLKPAMKSWRGKTSDARGTAFNSEVAEKLRSVGWNAQPDIKMNTILGSSFKNLGDIDVLAWNPESGRVLLIECKDPKFNKTLGEIAEQLADFQGDLRPDGRPDDLLKHLNRIAAIQGNLAELQKFLGVATLNVPEGHVVFRNPVPMQFAWDHLKARVGLFLFDELGTI
jgi:hypothetical protein